MAFSPKPWLSILGLNVQGDLGGWTLYTDRYHRITCFPAAPPLVPRSPYQAARRQALASAAFAWKACPSTYRKSWEAAAKKAHLRITGYNLFTYWILKQDDQAIQTIERQTGITLRPLPPCTQVAGIG